MKNDKNIVNNDIEIAQRVKAIRKDRQLTQRQFAEILGITQPTLSDIERGRIGVSAKIIKRLSEKFNIPSDWILHEHNGLNIDTNYNCMPKYPISIDSLPGKNHISDRFGSNDVNQQLNELIEDQIHLYYSFLDGLLYFSANIRYDIQEGDANDVGLSKWLNSFGRFFRQFDLNSICREENPYLKMRIEGKLQLLKVLFAAQSKILVLAHDFLRDALNSASHTEDHNKD